jgi:hypothetical protein
VGIYGQWVDCWRPTENSNELAIILEDDVDLSPWAYKWLKAAYDKYHDLPNIGGYSLYEGSLPELKEPPSDKVAFMFRRIGTPAFSPHPKWWGKFQDWFHNTIGNKSFHPYVKNDPLLTGWYKTFEKSNKQHTMWGQWFIYYADSNNLFTIFSNIAKSHHFSTILYLGYHRQEDGLHFKNHNRVTNNKLILKWNNSFAKLLDILPKYDVRGKRIKH